MGNEAISKNPIYETFCVVIGAYLSYSLAHLEFFQLSGDVAIFFYGLMMAHYNKYNFSLESFKSIGLSFNLMMQMSEAVSFIYIGLSFEDAIRGHLENFIYAAVILTSLLLCRSLVVAVVAIIKRNKTNFRVFGGEWVAAVSSCLLKGPLAYIFMNILLPDIPECIDVFNEEHYKAAYPLFVLQICVVGSLLVLHPLNYLVFKCAVREKLHEGEDIDIKLEREKEHKENLLEDNWVVDRERPRVFAYVDEFYLKPLFIRDYFKRKNEINEMKILYDELAVHYDHGIHLEHEIHEIHHRVCGEGHGDEDHDHHGSHGHGHSHAHGKQNDHHGDSSHSESENEEEKNKFWDGIVNSDFMKQRIEAKTEIVEVPPTTSDIQENKEKLKEDEPVNLVFDSMVSENKGPE